MFHRENTSIETVNTNNNKNNNNNRNNNNNKNKNGNNNNQKVNNKKQQTESSNEIVPVTYVKAKDVELRKSDRRDLLNHAEQFFTSSSSSNNINNINFDNNNSNHDDGETTKYNMMLSVINDVIQKMLEIIFLKDTVYSRIVKLKSYGKVTLYFRSASTSTVVSTTTTTTTTYNNTTTSTIDLENNNRDIVNTIIQKLFNNQWPYYSSDQCIWLYVDLGVNKCDQYHVPSLALISTIVPVIIETYNQLNIKETLIKDNEQQFQHGLSVLLSSFLPIVQVPSDASKYLINGANLMKAGMRKMSTLCFVSPSETNNNNSIKYQFDEKPRSVVLVSVQGNDQPFAIGLLESDIKSENDIGYGTTGIGVTIISCYGDDIWKQQQIQQIAYMQQQSQLIGNQGGSIYQQYQKQKTNIPNMIINPIGGATYDHGHYGNVGFIDGKRVVPIITTTTNTTTTTTVDDNIVEKDEPEEVDAWDTENDNENVTKTTNETESVALNGIESIQDVDDVSESDVAEREDYQSSLQSEIQDPSFIVTSTTPPPLLSDDDVLHIAVLNGLYLISSIQGKSLLPITIANFYANFVLPNRPSNTHINLKQTRYKKFGNYVIEHRHKIDNNNLLIVGPDPSKKSNGINEDLMLLGINKHNSEYKEFVQSRNNDDNSNNIINDPSSNRGNIVDLFIVPKHFIPLLRLDLDAVKAANATSAERKNTSMLIAKEMKEILDEYITREGLIKPGNNNVIVLDAPLTAVLYPNKSKKNNINNIAADSQQVDVIDSTPEEITRKDIAVLWKSKMEPAYALVQDSQNKKNEIVKIGRGKPPKVYIDVGRVKSRKNKVVTRIRGVEVYGIDPYIFAKDIAVRYASSTNCDETPELNGRPALSNGLKCEINIQGNWSTEINALLLSDDSLTTHGGSKGSNYYLPKNSIDIKLQNGVVKKKK